MCSLFFVGEFRLLCNVIVVVFVYEGIFVRIVFQCRVPWRKSIIVESNVKLLPGAV